MNSIKDMKCSPPAENVKYDQTITIWVNLTVCQHKTKLDIQLNHA